MSVTRQRRVTVLVSVLLQAALMRPAHAETSPGPCACIDLRDARRHEEEVELRINAFFAEASKTPPKTPYTASGYKAAELRVESLVANYHFKSPDETPWPALPGELGPSRTDDISCEVTIAPSLSACRAESLRRHEKMHHEVCESGTTPPRLTHSYHEGWPLQSVLLEEVKAYTEERDFLSPRVQELEKRCKGWVGTITYVRITNGHAPGSVSSGREEITLDVEGQRTSEGYVAAIYTASISMHSESDDGGASAINGGGSGRTEVHIDWDNWEAWDIGVPSIDVPATLTANQNYVTSQTTMSLGGDGAKDKKPHGAAHLEGSYTYRDTNAGAETTTTIAWNLTFL